MSRTFEIPFLVSGNRQYLTGQQMAEEPAIREFVERFPACFEFDCTRDIVWFYPDGDAPETKT